MIPATSTAPPMSSLGLLARMCIALRHWFPTERSKGGNDDDDCFPLEAVYVSCLV